MKIGEIVPANEILSWKGIAVMMVPAEMQAK